MSSSNKWTQEQQGAIYTKGCDLLVAAAAGSGKTAVLVERIIKKVTSGEGAIDIDKLLVVTFTNAAASEMRERIGEAISSELDLNPDSTAFQRQLTLLPKASITTIHSFCLDVIRNNFHIINIDPSFRISDETEAILLKQEAIEDLFDSKYEMEDNESFLALVESYGGNKTDEKLEEIIVDIYKFAESSPWPEKWLLACAEDFNIDETFKFEESKWAQCLLKNINIEITGLYANMKRGIGIIRENEEFAVYLPNFESEGAALNAILEQTDITWGSLNDNLNGITFDRLKPCKNVDETLKKCLTDIRTSVKKRIKDIQSNIMGISAEKIKIEMQGLYPTMKTLSQMVIEFKKIYREKKKERGIIDFNDIEHYALDILTQIDEEGNIEASDTAKLYRERFEEVLVDEYQDSNLVQEVMLSMVSRREGDARNLFMVGDVKQSIYRFRQAMPELFLKKYNEFSEKEGNQRKITLYKNFRSRLEVVEGVNYIFKQIMSVNIGELNYNDREALNYGADFPTLEGDGIVGGPVELHIVENNKNAEVEVDVEVATETEAEEKLEEEEDVDNIQLEARMVAIRIHELVEGNEKEFKVFDKGMKAYRKVEYKDIVILLRTTKNWANIFLDEFSKERIPAFADTGTGYFDTIEIKTILALLQIIDNPMQDIPMLTVLRSPIFAFTPDELIDIRLMNEKVNFYEALKMIALDGISGISIKVKDFLEKLSQWHDKSIYTPIDEFLWFLYMETGYFSYVSAMPGGVQRQANLKVLFERARQYGDTSYKGLFNFNNFITKLKRNSGDMGSAKILGENENVVRIMSIHKSKGLEFPVVFVSGTGKGFNMMDLRKGILYHRSLGFGPDFVDYKRRYSYSSTMKEAIKTRIRLETLSEEMRVLYVAFTRAKEKLIITGCIKNIEKSAGKWSHSSEKINEKLSEYEILTSKCYLDWICPGIMNHQDGEKLIQISGALAKAKLETDGCWDIKIWDRRTILTGKDNDNDNDNAEGETDLKVEDKENMDEEHSFSEFAHEIDRRLSFVYPHEECAGIPAKLSVSELKRAKNLEFHDEDSTQMFSTAVMKKPMFMETKQGITAPEKGTIMHLVMQHINFSKSNNVEEIGVQIKEMVASEILTQSEAEVIDPRKIETLFKSTLGNRMKSSLNVIRELPFTVEIGVTQIYKNLPMEKYVDENIMLQGVIDCFFEEAGEYVLLDYKTDYVEEGKLDIIKERYRLQLDCYEKALERISGRKVKGKYIYLFSNNQIIEY